MHKLPKTKATPTMAAKLGKKAAKLNKAAALQQQAAANEARQLLEKVTASA